GGVEARGVGAGIQVDVTGECALEAIDQTMHGAGCARLGDVEADIVMVAVDALQPPQIGSDLEARISAIEVRPCPLCKMFACVLAKYTAPCTDPRIAVLIARDVFLGLPYAAIFSFPTATAPHEQLIALTLVKRA